MNEFNWIKLILTPRGRLLSTIGSEEILRKAQPIAGNADVPSAPRQRREVFSPFALSAGETSALPALRLRLTGLAATLSVFIHRGIPI